jgi:hypothetical protein
MTLIRISLNNFPPYSCCREITAMPCYPHGFIFFPPYSCCREIRRRPSGLGLSTILMLSRNLVCPTICVLSTLLMLSRNSTSNVQSMDTDTFHPIHVVAKFNNNPIPRPSVCLSTLLMLSRNQVRQQRYWRLQCFPPYSCCRETKPTLSTLLVLSRNTPYILYLPFPPIHCCCETPCDVGRNPSSYIILFPPYSCCREIPCEADCDLLAILYLLLAAWWFERVGNVYHFEH